MTITLFELFRDIYDDKTTRFITKRLGTMYRYEIHKEFDHLYTVFYCSESYYDYEVYVHEDDVNIIRQEIDAYWKKKFN